VWHIDGFNSLLEMRSRRGHTCNSEPAPSVSILYWRCQEKRKAYGCVQRRHQFQFSIGDAFLGASTEELVEFLSFNSLLEMPFRRWQQVLYRWHYHVSILYWRCRGTRVTTYTPRSTLSRFQFSIGDAQ